MARITGSLLISARGGWRSESASDAQAGAGAGVNAERETRKAEQARPAPARLFRVSTSAFRVSQDPIHKGAQEHDYADQSVGAEEGRIDPRQVSRLHEPVLPRNQRRADGHADVVRDPEIGRASCR